MSNVDYRPDLEALMPREGAPKPSPNPKTHLDSDAYWHTGTRHDGRGPDWEEDTSAKTHSAVCAIVTPH